MRSQREGRGSAPKRDGRKDSRQKKKRHWLVFSFWIDGGRERGREEERRVLDRVVASSLYSRNACMRAVWLV